MGVSIHTKQIKALRLGIGALERERRAKFAAGEAAYKQGVRVDVMNSDGVKGTGFTFAEDDHKSYQQYTKAIQELEDLIEILEDPGVTIDEYAELPMFANSLLQSDVDV